MMAQKLSFQNLVLLDFYSLTPHSTNKSMSRHFHVQMPRKLKDGFIFFSQIFCTSYTDYVRREEKGNRTNRRFKMKLHTTLQKLRQPEFSSVKRPVTVLEMEDIYEILFTPFI